MQRGTPILRGEIKHPRRNCLFKGEMQILKVVAQLWLAEWQINHCVEALEESAGTLTPGTCQESPSKGAGERSRCDVFSYRQMAAEASGRWVQPLPHMHVMEPGALEAKFVPREKLPELQGPAWEQPRPEEGRPFPCCVLPVGSAQMCPSCQLSKEGVFKGPSVFHGAGDAGCIWIQQTVKLVTGTAFVSVFYCLKILRPSYWFQDFFF